MNKSIFSLIFIMVFSCVSPTFGEDPVLVIEPGGHKAMIRDVIFTKDGSSLVSASDDKTVMVWDVATGDIKRIIRGESGEGLEGKIYAAALSPDNEWLAVGGCMATYTGNNETELGKIRLYHFPTGRLTTLLKGHTNVVLSLAFSNDSRYLASGSFDQTVRIWDMARKKGIHTLSGHKKYILGVSFLPDNRRVVSASLDHTLILWDAMSGKSLKRMEGHTGAVRSVAVSPDGKTIASGSWDKTIRLWDGRDGSFMKVLARLERNVGSLSFSPDGKTILTGSGSHGSGQDLCRLFAVPSGQELYAFDRHKNVVLATGFSPNGNLCATGGGDDEEIYLWDAHTHAVKHRLAGKGAPVWNVGFGRDSASIAWGNKWEQSVQSHRGPLQTWLRLASKTGRLEFMGPIKQKTAFVRAMEKQGGYELKTQKGGPYGYQDAILQIIKNNTVIANIERDAGSGYGHRSFTLTADNRHVLSGGGTGVLTLYSTQTGKKIHDFIGHTGDVCAVAVSPDGRKAVSGSIDQTVRVWNMATGECLLTLFAGVDGEWVAWTKSGYYTASPKGDQLIGWQINKGPDKNPEFYSADQFTKILYKPDIVAGTWTALSESKALEQLGAKGGYSIADIAEFAPPEIRILKPEDGFVSKKPEITLEVKIDGKKADIKDIVVYVNGRQTLAAKDRRIQDIETGSIKRFTIPLLDAKNSIRVLATNTRNATADAMIQVLLEGTKAYQARGDLYFLSVGVNHLENIPGNDLSLAAKDAKDMGTLMKQLEGRLFKKVHLFVLSDVAKKKPTSSEIEDALYELKDANRSDTVMLFLAGHGVLTERNDFIFLTRDAVRYDGGRYKMSSVLKWDSVREVMSYVNSRRIVFLDTCYSGGVDLTDMVKKGYDANIAILASSSGSQTSKESVQLGNGYFTHAILKGLGAKLPADGYKDGIVDITELSSYVRGEVKSLSSNTQTPTLTLPKGQDDIPFFVK
jgi:WD40 repeat protein